MKCGDPLTFLPVPPAGHTFHFFGEIFQHSIMGCNDVTEVLATGHLFWSSAACSCAAHLGKRTVWTDKDGDSRTGRRIDETDRGQ